MSDGIRLRRPAAPLPSRADLAFLLSCICTVLRDSGEQLPEDFFNDLRLDAHYAKKFSPSFIAAKLDGSVDLGDSDVFEHLFELLSIP